MGYPLGYFITLDWHDAMEVLCGYNFAQMLRALYTT